MNAGPDRSQAGKEAAARPSGAGGPASGHDAPPIAEPETAARSGAADDRAAADLADASGAAIDLEARAERMRQAPDGSPEALLREATISEPVRSLAESVPAVETLVERSGATDAPSAGTPGSGTTAASAKSSLITSEPELANLSEIQSLIEREYPPLLRDAGIDGVAQVWLQIGADGEIRRTRLAEGTGHARLDEAALRVASAARFAPALNRGEATSAWVSLPIAFISR